VSGQAAGAERRTSSVELLWDLVFVFAVTQVSTLLAHVMIGLWCTYLLGVAGAAEQTLRTNEQPVLAAADGYSYMHLLLVTGIIVFAVGAKNTVGHLADPLSVAGRLALCGGVALYLAGLLAFGLRMIGSVRVELGIAAAACLAGAGLPAWAVAAMVGGWACSPSCRCVSRCARLSELDTPDELPLT
jgi:low temperature requirement protein LtrA